MKECLAEVVRFCQAVRRFGDDGVATVQARLVEDWQSI